MFRRILIANRGEVAARVLRTCQRMGVEAVAVASEADLDASWLGGASSVVAIGPARAAASYLDADALIEAALATGCAAVHPGWGFLSENEAFAARVASAGLTFIGPTPNQLRQMGDKAVAKETMRSLGLPLIPGSDGPVADAAEARRIADTMGYPVLLKAVSGGGGRGMRSVDRPEDLEPAFRQASAEALAAFGDGSMYLERRLVNARHVEVQVFGDHWGSAVHLGERECSLQRRHQKVVEESPSPGLSAEERARVLPLVASAMAAFRYRGAGTVEMLLDASGALYFMETNTRLQVEHCVTEEVTGLDLVEWQLRVASNERLPLSQAEVDARRAGAAIEFRINAEDPDNGFRPCPGRVTALRWPEGVRVDTHLAAGDRIPPNYDSMLAKLIVRGVDRADALAKARVALDQVVVEGVTTNLALHRKIVRWEPFVSGRYDTSSLEGFVAG